MKKQHLYKPDDELLRKYLQGELSESESEALEKLLESDNAAREHFRQTERIWNLSAGLKNYESIDTDKDYSELKKRLILNNVGIQNDEPGTASGENSFTRNRKSGRVPQMNPAFRILRVAAAVLLVAVSTSLIYYYTGKHDMKQRDWVSFSNHNPSEEVILPDGTRVWLNSGSSLLCPAEFGKNKRKVQLKGEGYFEVAPEKDRPFIASAGNEAVVEVLGTAFHLRTDPEDNKIFLNVSEGRVAFYPKGKKRKTRIFEKDEQAEYKEGSISQHASIDLNFLSWKNQTLEFESTPLPDVVEQLGRHYQKEIRITGMGLDTLSLTGIYSRQSIQEVLDEISIVLDVEFIEVEGIIQVN